MSKLSETPVPIPRNLEGGRVNVHGNGYVYLTTRAWWDKASRNSKDNRRLIGKVLPDDPAMMRPNQYFLDHLASPITHSTVLAGGVFVAALRAADTAGILSALRKAFPETWRQLFAAAVYWIDRQSGASPSFRDWFFDNCCGLSAAMDGHAFTRLFQDIGKKRLSEDQYRKSIREAVEKRSDRAEKTGRRIIASVRYDRCGDHAGVAPSASDHGEPAGSLDFWDEATGITLFRAHFTEGLAGKDCLSQLQSVLEMGYDSIHLMPDQGPFTDAVLRDFPEMRKRLLKKKIRISFSARIPSSFRGASAVIGTFQGKIHGNEAHALSGKEIYGMEVPEHPLKEHFPDFFTFAQPPLHVYLFYDALLAARERDLVERKAFLPERQAYTEHQYLTAQKAARDPERKRDLTGQKNREAIQEDLRRAGFFLMAASGDDGPAFEIGLSFLQDRQEEVLCRKEAFFSLMEPGTGSDEAYAGAMLAADIAQNIEEAMVYSLRSMSCMRPFIAEAVAELHKVKLQVEKDGSMKPAFPLTEKQKGLLRCFGLDAMDFDTYVRSLQWGRDYGDIRNREEIKKEEKEKRKAEKKAFNKADNA